jgi:hypothetical protein
MQTRKALLIAAAATLLSAVPALAADTLGRISYIYPDGHRLILDAGKTYTLAPSVDTKSIGVAEFVRLTLGPDGRVTSISPGPPALAGYWTGAGTQQS